MQEKRQIIDPRTGEVVSEFIADFTDTLNEEGYRFPSHKLGARMFADIEFPEAMTDAEIGRMTRLARRYMIPKTNMIGYRQGRTINPYSAREIGELVGLNADSKRKVFVAKMLRLRVLQRIQTNSGPQYYVNPAYFMANGQRLSLDLFLLFRDELTPILPAWVMAEFLRQTPAKAMLGGDANTEAERIVQRQQSEGNK